MSFCEPEIERLRIVLGYIGSKGLSPDLFNGRAKGREILRSAQTSPANDRGPLTLEGYPAL
jgi:hypothetical protein